MNFLKRPLTKSLIKMWFKGSCGSCWAFSAVAATEKFYFDKSKTQVDLSQQELVDCDKSSSGCNGGSISGGLTYASKNGLAPASKYPYKGANGACKSSSSNSVKIGGSVENSSFSMSKASSCSSKGIHAGFSVYGKGKIRSMSSSKDTYDVKLSGECSQGTSHAINMVSATSTTLRVINSWGTGWGESGYKTIKPCSDSAVWGTATNIRYLH